MSWPTWARTPCSPPSCMSSALKPDGKQTMDARSFAAGVQGIKDGGLTWEETHA